MGFTLTVMCSAQLVVEILTQRALIQGQSHSSCDWYASFSIHGALFKSRSCVSVDNYAIEWLRSCSKTRKKPRPNIMHPYTGSDCG
jgi:hypothetical protein